MKPYFIPVAAPAELVDDGDEGEEDSATDCRQHSANGVRLIEKYHIRELSIMPINSIFGLTEYF